MRYGFIIIAFSVVVSLGFTCSYPPPPQPKTEIINPTEESLQAQSTDLLRQKGYTETTQEGIWQTTPSGVVCLWRISKISVEPPNKPGDSFLGTIILDRLKPGDPKPHGSFAECFVWQEATRMWAPAKLSVITSEGSPK